MKVSMKVKLLSSIALLSCAFFVTAIEQKTAALIHSASKADLGVINKERIYYWLEKRGELAANATAKEKQQALANYLAKKSFTAKKLPGEIGRKVRLAEQTAINATKASSSNKINKAKLKTNSASQANALQVTSEVKVLAVLIDFTDLKHDANGLTSSDTSMYYDDYSVEHYNGLLFSTSGYEGPSGQTLESAYQYYQQESGGSLAFTGNAVGWVTADNNAAFYGGNDAEDDDNDLDVPALILEAVTKAVADLNVDLSEYDKSDFFDLDGDGNINEPDGIIDHVMVFHSSVGEEAGGGTLGDDAIWSHRFFVFDENNQPVNVPGSNVRLYGYTVTPIDAASGVVVHEFGHDLGVPDEYNTSNVSGALGSPVSDWSLMASGSWVGSPAGSRPSGFSPYVKDIFQEKYQGNWINQQIVTLDDLESESIALVSANNHQNGVNQVKVNLPATQVDFGAPYTGNFQFYSNKGHMLNNELSFTAELPAGTSTLTMKARWNIEEDYDYVQVRVNDTVVAGNHTRASNPLSGFGNVTHYITANSANITGAEGDLGWLDLSFDLSTFQNQTATVKIVYVTDQAASEYGFVADDINISNNASTIYSNSGESESGYSLNGFSRIGATIDGDSHNYYAQLRSHQGTDASLNGSAYDAGLLVWYRNDGIENNEVNEHPGEVFIGVVDADQNLIKSGSSNRGTASQIRDAAFSLFDQTPANGDSHLSANSKFSDINDYSSPQQPESGLKLPKLGLSIELTDQSSNSSTGNILLTKSNVTDITVEQEGLQITLSVEDADIDSNSTFNWNMGDGTLLTGTTVTHTYVEQGNYDISVVYQTAAGQKDLSYAIAVGEIIEGEIEFSAEGSSFTFTPVLTGGFGSLDDFTYRWDFGDSSNTDSTQTPSHDYETSGDFTVTLTVTDATLQSFIFTTSVTIENTLAANITESITNLRVVFAANASGGDGQNIYAWDFGDDSTSSIENPTHTYSSAGTYTVTLTVTDASNSAIVSSKNITVTAPVVTTPSTTTSSSSGGGSIGGFSLLLLLLPLRRKLTNNE